MDFDEALKDTIDQLSAQGVSMAKLAILRAKALSPFSEETKQEETQAESIGIKPQVTLPEEIEISIAKVPEKEEIKSPEMTPEEQQAATDKLIAEMMAQEGGSQYYQDDYVASPNDTDA